MAAIWINNMAAILMSYDRHMTKPHGCHMVSMWKQYGITIYLPYWHNMADIWYSHMPAILYPCGCHIAKLHSYHIDAIWLACG